MHGRIEAVGGGEDIRRAAHDVGERLIERARLVLVDQPGGESVTPWVSSCATTSRPAGELAEDAAIAVAEGHCWPFQNALL